MRGFQCIWSYRNTLLITIKTISNHDMPLFRHTCEVGASVHSRKTVRNRARTSFQCFANGGSAFLHRKTIGLLSNEKYPISGVDDGILLISPPTRGGESPRLPLDLSLGGGIAIFPPPTILPRGGESMLSPPS